MRDILRHRGDIYSSRQIFWSKSNNSSNAVGTKIQQTAFPKVVIKPIDIIVLNIAMVTRALEFECTSCRDLHMLTGSLPEESYPKTSHIVRLGNKW